jgi:hypothetical protein
VGEDEGDVEEAVSRALVVTAISAGVAGAALLYEGSTAQPSGPEKTLVYSKAEATFGAVLLGASLVALVVAGVRKASS